MPAPSGSPTTSRKAGRRKISRNSASTPIIDSRVVRSMSRRRAWYSSRMTERLPVVLQLTPVAGSSASARAASSASIDCSAMP